jgi:hypothetical protein
MRTLFLTTRVAITAGAPKREYQRTGLVGVVYSASAVTGSLSSAQAGGAFY